MQSTILAVLSISPFKCFEMFVCTPGPGGSSCSVEADVAFVLHSVSPGEVFAQLKMFLKLAAAKFTISLGNRLGVSLYGNTVSHQVSLDVSKDNKRFISAVDSLKPLVGSQPRLIYQWVRIHSVSKSKNKSNDLVISRRL